MMKESPGDDCVKVQIEPKLMSKIESLLKSKDAELLGIMNASQFVDFAIRKKIENLILNTKPTNPVEFLESLGGMYIVHTRKLNDGTQVEYLFNWNVQSSLTFSQLETINDNLHPADINIYGEENDACEKNMGDRLLGLVFDLQVGTPKK